MPWEKPAKFPAFTSAPPLFLRGYILGGAGIIGASILGSAIINSNRPIYTYPPVIYQSPVIVPMPAQQPMTQLVYVNVNGQLVPYYFINGQLIPVGR